MKREICCPRCAADWRDVAKHPQVAADGETVRVIEGELLGASARCDMCNKPLKHGEPCAAVSVIGRGQSDMPGWEAAYVMPPKKRGAAS